MKRSVKNVVNGLLLIGGLSMGFVGAGMISNAKDNSKTLDLQRRGKEVEENTQLDEEKLTSLIREQGNQLLIDEQTGKMYLAYINESNQVEIVEITEKEYNDLMNQAQRISENKEGSYIPREYLRGGETTSKKRRKQLKSEEGRKAVEEAKRYKKENK